MKRLPLVNLDVIGTRPEPVVPDGVWIEVQPHADRNEASYNAQCEEERINAANKDRSERLKKFQKDVKRRVTKAAYLQRNNIAHVETKQMEHEIDMLYRSASAAEKSTPKKNRCSYNVNPITINCSGKISAVDVVQPVDQCPGHTKSTAKLDARSEECEQLVKDARRRLAKNLVAPPGEIPPEKELPGGVWGTGTTRDKSAARILSEEMDRTEPQNPDSADPDIVQTIPAVAAPDYVALTSVQEAIVLGHSTTVDNAPLDGSGDNLHRLPPAHVTCKVPSVVHFNVDSKHWQSESVLCDEACKQAGHVSKSAAGGDIPMRISDNTVVQGKPPGRKTYLGELTKPPVLHPGAVELDERRANERARWLSRRVFADAERERTREQARMREHQQRVNRLREAKERERAEVEQKSRHQVEAVRVADEQLRQQARKEERRKAKAKESQQRKEKQDQRFVRAMKSQLRERVEQNRLELPALCMCASTFWETDPDTCANNCLFYKNHEAYAKALETVLQAVERNMGPFHKDALQRSAVSVSLVGDAGPTPFSSRRSNSARSQASSSLSVGKL